jgi:hypothetical protein
MRPLKSVKRAGWTGALVACLTFSQGVLAEATYGPIKAGESLWSVARKTGAGDVQARMKALFDSNPQAFVNGDMSRLKVGATLSLDGAPATPAPTATAAAPAARPVAPAPAAAPQPKPAVVAAPVAKPAAPATTAPVPPPPPVGAQTAAGEVVKVVGQASAATDPTVGVASSP